MYTEYMIILDHPKLYYVVCVSMRRVCGHIFFIYYCDDIINNILKYMGLFEILSPTKI
jgi:hypothetical protein